MRTLDISVQDRASRTAAEWLWPLLPIGVAVFCLSALIYYHVQYDVVQVRSAMQVVVAAIYQAIGFAPAVMFFLLLLTWSSIWFVTGRLDRPLMRIGRLLAMAVMLGVFLNLGDGGVSAAVHKGAVGAWLAGCLVAAIGYYPSIVLVWAVTFASLLLATDFFFSDSFERLRQRPRTETGVETSVTDHLRGLGSLTPPIAEPVPPVRPAPGDDAAVAVAAAPELDFLRALEAEEVAAADAPAASAEPEPAFEPRRRRSYFDRRRESEVEAATDAGPAELDDEEPTPGDLDVTMAAEWGPAAELGAELDAEANDPATDADVEVDAAMFAAQRPAVAADAPADRAHADEPEPALAEHDDEPEVAERPEHAAAREASAAAAEAPEPPEDAEVRPPEPTYVAIEPPPAPDEDEDAGAGDADDEPESAVSIPRPERSPGERPLPTPPRVPARREDAPARQQKLFAADVDDELVAEAIELARGQSRVTATLLQRRLRIDYQQAMDVLAQLGARGVVELEPDASQGRVVV